MNLNKKFPRLFALYENIDEDALGLIAAGVAFYFLMAAFPALAAIISLYGIFSDPAFVGEQINLLSRFLPAEAVSIFASQTNSLLKAGSETLSISFLISIMFAIYSAAKGIGALIKGLNITYNEREKRGFIKLSLTGFILTSGLMIYLLTALTMVAGLPAFLKIFNFPEFTTKLYLFIRWPLLFFTALVGLEILYSFAPSHARFKWNWISWGSVTATCIWLFASSFFSFFITNFGSYNETYGSISAIVILLLWFWMSAMTILFGAEINHLFNPQDAIEKKPELNLKAGSEEPPENSQQ